MLVLSRRIGELVFIILPDGRRVGVMVTDIDRGKIRLGFTAPPDLKIYREELLPDPTPGGRHEQAEPGNGG